MISTKTLEVDVNKYPGNRSRLPPPKSQNVLQEQRSLRVQAVNPGRNGAMQQRWWGFKSNPRPTPGWDRGLNRPEFIRGGFGNRKGETGVIRHLGLS